MGSRLSDTHRFSNGGVSVQGIAAQHNGHRVLEVHMAQSKN